METLQDWHIHCDVPRVLNKNTPNDDPALPASRLAALSLLRHIGIDRGKYGL
jgi:hypothetical protein